MEDGAQKSVKGNNNNNQQWYTNRHRKRNKKQSPPEAPFPGTSLVFQEYIQQYLGEVIGYAVWIRDSIQVQDLWNSGYYGKGIFSRSQPVFNRKQDTHKIDGERSNKRNLGFHRKNIDSSKKLKLQPEQSPSSLNTNNVNQEPEAQNQSIDVEEFEMKEIPEFLQLGLEEALFLCHVAKCLDIQNEKSNLTPEEAWKLFCTIQPNFPMTYTSYYHYRVEGLIPRYGTKYGVDWVIYTKGPAYFHAEKSVIVNAVNEDTWTVDETTPQRSLTWLNLLNIGRVTEQVKKGLTLCFVYKPTLLSLEDIAKDPNCITQFKITELNISRWKPEKTREKVHFPPRSVLPKSQFRGTHQDNYGTTAIQRKIHRQLFDKQFHRNFVVLIRSLSSTFLLNPLTKGFLIFILNQKRTLQTTNTNMSTNQTVPDTEWQSNPKHPGKRTQFQKTRVTKFTEPNPFDILSDLPSNKTSQDIYTTPGIYAKVNITGAGPVGVSSNIEDFARVPSMASTDITIDNRSDIPNKFGDNDISDKWAPRLDMYRISDHLILEFELPGIQNPYLAWANDKKSLVLQGSKGKDRDISQDTYYGLRERHYGDYWRWVNLPTDLKLDLDSVTTTLCNAILKLKIKISA